MPWDVSPDDYALERVFGDDDLPCSETDQEWESYDWLSKANEFDRWLTEYWLEQEDRGNCKRAKVPARRRVDECIASPPSK